MPSSSIPSTGVAIVEVVSAVIVRAGRVLLTQRRPEQDFPFTWECPGGKVDGNESNHAALRRELREEIGAEVRGINECTIWSGEFRNMVQRAGRAHVFVMFYPTVLVDGSPTRPREGQGLGWFTPAELRGLALAPANLQAASAVEAHVRLFR